MIAWPPRLSSEVSTRAYFASVLVMLVSGLCIGRYAWQRPDVSEKSKIVAESSSKFDMREDWASSFTFTATTPPAEKIKWYVKYLPGAKPGECAIAEVGGESEKTGAGTMSGSVSTSGAVVAKGEAKAKTDTETSRDETRAPLWSFAIQAGASIPEPLLTLPGAPHAVVGISVDRKIWGQVRGGVWISSMGAAGVEVRW